MLHESQFLRAWRDRKQDSCLTWIVPITRSTSYIFLDLIFSCVWVSRWFVSRRKKFCSQDWRGKKKRDLTRARNRERERERYHRTCLLLFACESRTQGKKKYATHWLRLTYLPQPLDSFFLFFPSLSISTSRASLVSSNISAQRSRNQCRQCSE